jgi:monoamine oxidase
MILPRRTMLGGAMAALTVPRIAAAAEPSDVIVIGAGIAGLTAALVLQDAGMKVRVLEGSVRAVHDRL